MTEDICQVGCQVNVIHQKQVAQASENMPGDHLVSEAAELFSLLGDNSRLRILLALKTTELCVCDLAAGQTHADKGACALSQGREDCLLYARRQFCAGITVKHF